MAVPVRDTNTFMQPNPEPDPDPPMRSMSVVYLAAQFEELHDWARSYRGNRRLDQTLDYFFTGQLSLRSTVHNLVIIKSRHDWWQTW